ncbi:Fc.00g106460.m01.CDS01 [Cosmosporella sp. VM-42]
MDEKARHYIAVLHRKHIGTDLESTWYCIAACSFAASNKGQYVADVFKEAIKDRQDDFEYHKHVLKRIKEGLLKTGIIYGIPRVINAFRALIKALPSPESNETSSIRNHISVPAETGKRGEEYMRNIFRADLDPFLATMDQYWPDLRTLVVTYIYGYYQSDTSILDSITTSQLNIASLVPMDVTAEVAWHMRGTIRNGGTEEQLTEVYDIAMRVCEICEVLLKNEMPKAQDVINEERLIID